VTLPLALPGIVASALLVFTLSIDDYVITSFVAGVGATTLPLLIYSMLKVGVTPEVNAISTLLLAVTIVLIAGGHRLLQEKEIDEKNVFQCFLAVAVLVVACGGGKGAKPQGKIVNIYIWTNYLPQEVVDELERPNGIHANVDTFDSNEAVLAKLQSGVAGYDVAVPSDYMLKILIPQGLVQPLDHSRLPHLKNLDSAIPQSEI